MTPLPARLGSGPGRCCSHQLDDGARRCPGRKRSPCVAVSVRWSMPPPAASVHADGSGGQLLGEQSHRRRTAAGKRQEILDLSYDEPGDQGPRRHRTRPNSTRHRTADRWRPGQTAQPRPAARERLLALGTPPRRRSAGIEHHVASAGCGASMLISASTSGPSAG